MSETFRSDLGEVAVALAQTVNSADLARLRLRVAAATGEDVAILAATASLVDRAMLDLAVASEQLKSLVGPGMHAAMLDVSAPQPGLPSTGSFEGKLDAILMHVTHLHDVIRHEADARLTADLKAREAARKVPVLTTSPDWSYVPDRDLFDEVAIAAMTALINAEPHTAPQVLRGRALAYAVEMLGALGDRRKRHREDSKDVA